MITNQEVYQNMIAVRYRNEQNRTRNAGIDNCKDLNLAVEFYAGSGGLTEVYKQHFKKIISNDINKNSSAQHNYDAVKFAKELPSILGNEKIDLVDFDCYGCPSYAIQEFFNQFTNKHCPIVLCLSDGLGQFLKRKKDEEGIRKRYLIDEEIVFDKIWNRHGLLIESMVSKLCERYDMKYTKLDEVQTKFKNYVLASYLLE